MTENEAKKLANLMGNDVREKIKEEKQKLLAFQILSILMAILFLVYLQHISHTQHISQQPIIINTPAVPVKQPVIVAPSKQVNQQIIVKKNVLDQIKTDENIVKVLKRGKQNCVYYKKDIRNVSYFFTVCR